MNQGRGELVVEQLCHDEWNAGLLSNGLNRRNVARQMHFTNQLVTTNISEY